MGPPEMVMKYLRDQNRPYSANDIFMNMHKEIGKTGVQKALDQLVEKGNIIEKVYGKQKVYAIKQDDTVSGDLGKELNELDSKIGDLSSRLSSVEEELKSLESQLRELQSTPTTKEAQNEKALLEDRVKMLKEKLRSVSQGAVQISAEDKEKIQKNYDYNLKGWRKRKRLCMDIVDSILEGYPKDKKTLLEEIGIETDESVGVSMKL